MPLIDLARLRESPLCRDPFDFVVVEDFLARDSLPALVDAFPAIRGHGSYPLPTLSCAPLFARLARELEGGELRGAIEGRFAIDLADRPAMITLRGRSDGTHDG